MPQSSHHLFSFTVQMNAAFLISYILDQLLSTYPVSFHENATPRLVGGDMQALRLCMERLCPPRKDRPISFALPSIASVSDIVGAQGALIAAVASGEVTPSEAGEVSKLLDAYARAVEVSELAERIAKLEARTNQ